MPNQIAIQAQTLLKRFGPTVALNGAGFVIGSGEIYGLLGPNGAGKSTIINILCGLIRPDAGVASIEGFNLAREPDQAKQALGVVPQEPAIYSELTARQNLMFFGRLYRLRGRALRERVEHSLEMVKLRERADDRVAGFSGGLLRRLSIAVGILHEPRVVLMDEPTVGLDPQNRQNILDLVKSIAARGCAVLYTSHYMAEVEQICDRVGIIDHGRVLAEGTVPELQRIAGNADTVTLKGRFAPDGPGAPGWNLPDAQIIRRTEEEMELQVTNAESRIPALLAAAARSGEVKSVSITHPSLETLFMQLTGRELRD